MKLKSKGGMSVLTVFSEWLEVNLLYRSSPHRAAIAPPVILVIPKLSIHTPY